MLYKDLQFLPPHERPFFYTNFVATIDGKVMVLTSSESYWPIGSSIDHEVLVELRACADLLIHGKNTALWYRALNSLEKESFKNARKLQGKAPDLPYLVISNTPDDRLIRYLDSKDKQKPFLVTSENAYVSDELAQIVQLIRCGENKVDLQGLVSLLQERGFKNVLVEGGPTVLGAFFAHDFIDEIFLTIAPKIFGNSRNAALTMVEGYLFPPDKIKKCELLSVKQVGNELFLHYKVLR